VLAVAALAALGIALGAYAKVATSRVSVSEKEFKILPAAVSAKPGKVTFRIRNTGHLTHEFIVLKTNLAPSKLPVKGAKAVLVGKVEGRLKAVAAGKIGHLTVTLPKGHYVLLCNLPAHYQAGQRAALVVK
jgi:uncharacterized cupredoxin-like copper-binding protein